MSCPETNMARNIANALVRGQLGAPKLGVQNGLPVTVVSTTLQELAAASACQSALRRHALRAKS
jgi:hypothetical protein